MSAAQAGWCAWAAWVPKATHSMKRALMLELVAATLPVPCPPPRPGAEAHAHFCLPLDHFLRLPLLLLAAARALASLLFCSCVQRTEQGRASASCKAS